MRLLLNTPWYVLLLCLASAAGLSLLLYFRNKKNTDAPQGVRLGLIGLRFLGIFLVALLLADILLRQVINETQQPRVLIAVDNSGSMVAGNDSAAVRKELMNRVRALTEKVAGRYDVSTIYFGPGASTHPPGSFADKETDIDRLFTEVTTNYANDNIGALLLVSDGIYNKGANPAYAADRLSFPVHVMMMGDTAEKTDVVLTRVNHNQVAYAGNNFPVEVQVNARKFSGEKVTVELRQGGNVKASKEITVNSAAYSGLASFTLAANAPGLQRYTAVLRTAKKESNTSNNSQEFVLEVIDNREKVLLVAAAPHPDILALRDVIANTGSYEVETLTGEAVVPALEGYNLVILHGTPYRQDELLIKSRELKLPCWVINPASPDKLPGIRITGTMNRVNDAEPFYDATFGYFNLSDELKRFLEDLPAVKVFFGNYDVPAGSNVLLKQRLGAVQTDHPLLYFNSSNDEKSAVFLGEGLWKWRMRDYSANGSTGLFSELISKCVQYLVVKADKSFFRIRTPRIVQENEPVIIDAELYNKSYQPVNMPDVFFTITNESGKKFNYTFSKSGNAYHLDLGNLPPGEYKYRGSVNFSGENFSKDGSFVIRETAAERLNTVADHDLLRQIARRSGGQAFSNTQWEKLTEMLASESSLPAVVYSQTLTRPLVDQKFIFALILLIFTVEWFLRKRFLLI